MSIAKAQKSVGKLKSWEDFLRDQRLRHFQMAHSPSPGQQFEYVGNAFVIIQRRGGPMANILAVIAQLEAERQRGKDELARIDAALAALGSSSKRTISPASRRKMAAAQKARWPKKREKRT
jgi:hypothetical protein